MMDQRILDTFNKIQQSGFSFFFATSSFLNCINGNRKRTVTLQNILEDQRFNDVLQAQKEKYEDWKEKKNWEFIQLYNDEKRENARAEYLKKCKLELEKTELKMFLQTWPLEISVATLQSILSGNNESSSDIYIVIGKISTKGERNPLAKSYNKIIDASKDKMSEIYGYDINILRFREDSVKTGGAALADIFAMMYSIPTLVILPQMDMFHNSLHFKLGYWYQDSIFPMQVKALSINVGDPHTLNQDPEWFDAKTTEIIDSLIAISATFIDNYQLLKYQKEPGYPTYFYNDKRLSANKVIEDYFMNEYRSLLVGFDQSLNFEGQNINIFNSVFDNAQSVKIRTLVKNILERL